MEDEAGGSARVIVIGAALKHDSNPCLVLVGAYEQDLVAMSEPVADEILDVLARPRFADVLTLQRQAEIARLPFSGAHWFMPGSA